MGLWKTDYKYSVFCKIYLLLRSFAKFDDFKPCDSAGINGESDKCAHLLPSVISGGSGVDMEQS